MKKLLLSIPAVLAGFLATAQAVDDSVAIGEGYANQAFYNMETGEVANVDNNNWDMAFDVSAFGATVRLNRRLDELFVYPGDTTNWESLDTAGMGSWDTYANGYMAWGEGAFNAPANPDVAEDLGWGLYNTITHHTDGDRIFVLSLGDGGYKKVWIKKLASGTYTFVHANLDNTEEEEVTVLKSDYTGKNFAYYSLATAEALDREPASADWDIVFTNYVVEVAPTYFYGVTGVLSNVETTVYKSEGAPVDEADYVGGSFETNISEIGYDWKTFDMGTFSYIIEDSLCYFIQTQAGDLWKLTFTGFNGSSDGKYYFTKEKVEAASLEENVEAIVSVYPNPANQVVNLNGLNASFERVELFNSNGQLVYTANANGQSHVEIAVDQLPEGLYILRSTVENATTNTQKIVIRH